MKEFKETLGLIRGYADYQKLCGVEYFPIEEKSNSNKEEENTVAVKKVVAKELPDTKIPTEPKAAPCDAQATGKEREFAELKKKMEGCALCKLSRGRTKLVFGEGSIDAKLVFVGEAPGADEDITGRPFVGRAGQLLTKIIQSIGFQREDVFIMNVVKCRPPENRNPEEDEINACNPFMLKQLEIIKPKIICALGTFSAHTLLKTDAPISKIRGKLYDYHGIKLIPTYHPAFLLRNPAKKREVWEDMQLIMEEYKKVT